ncbi:MAG TPA: hypothetical protein VHU13_07615 [Solirubrobacteraceae bacterium]|jgi:hypothetical protein|nr:hypothetical protein [Solirubrobacteraceae bacterium]
MRRVFLRLASLVFISLAACGSAQAGGWHSAQPSPPPPPPGQSSTETPVPLGHIGQISFWAPNHGLLITAGTEAIPAGLYYYNGAYWRELSTVCGGTDGRIAWANENDFWTIADQQTGQQLSPNTSATADQEISLCHFQNGEVVASYAEPIGVPGSYQRMDAAACSEPNDCWFGGETLAAGANGGAFHLHWNGTAMTAVPSLVVPEPQLEDPTHAVSDIVFYNGRFYESVHVRAGDRTVAGEIAADPSLIHRIAEGSANPFVPAIVQGPSGKEFAYGGGEPSQLSGFRFSGDTTGLLALAGAASQSSHSSPVLLVLGAGGRFQQVVLDDPSGALAAGDQIAGLAAEPGTDDAWASVDVGETGPSAPARVARVHLGGAVDPADILPEAGESLSGKGSAGAIACPAQGDCWLATDVPDKPARSGWLFHLGGDYPQDNDPYFQTLISYRPPDASIPFAAPETFPEDDSGANPPPIPSSPSPPRPSSGSSGVRAPLFSNVKEKLVKGTTLALSFTLATRSRVELVALRGKRAVAHSRRSVLGRGRHTVMLRLSRRAWPNKLALRVSAIGSVPLVPEASNGHEAIGGPTAVET